MRGMIENDPMRDLIVMMSEDVERSRQHKLRLMQVFIANSCMAGRSLCCNHVSLVFSLGVP